MIANMMIDDAIYEEMVEDNELIVEL